MDRQKYKQQLLDQLYAPYQNCMMCPLGNLGRTRVVFGEGDPDAKLLFIGEGPGADEDAQGKPFVGRSGKLLTKVLADLGIDRRTIFITNIVKCRPPENRKPLPLESKTCKELLLIKQIKIIRPHVICALGATAVEALLDQPVFITKIRGKQFSYEGSILIPTYHPAFVLRQPDGYKDFAADIAQAIELTKKS